MEWLIWAQPVLQPVAIAGGVAFVATLAVALFSR